MPREKIEARSYLALALKREEPQDILSEFEYRDDILAQFNVGGFQAQDIDFLIPEIPTVPPPDIPGAGSDSCKPLPDLARNLLPNIDNVVETKLGELSIPGLIISAIKTALTPIKSAIEAIGLGSVTGLAVDALLTGLGVVVAALTPATLIPVVGGAIQEAVTFFKTARDSLGATKGCDKSKIAIEPASCSVVADIYRASVKTAAENFPGANDANNEELKNLNLDLGRSPGVSIASSNDALLASRPIFATSLLDQFRQEIIEQADSNALKLYAQSDLAVLVSISNGLEACPHVAADLEAAAKELAEEYEAMGEDEDEDEE
ncbi:hypothetical protein BGW39_002430 [Mortierella sp. 14UC]|nr:hypothetical protein BGW39_002430 [Mortierella sp. 14UC]